MHCIRTNFSKLFIIFFICFFIFNITSYSDEIEKNEDSKLSLLEKIDKRATIFSKKMFSIHLGYHYFHNNYMHNNVSGNGFYIGIVEKLASYEIAKYFRYDVNLSIIYHYLDTGLHGLGNYYFSLNHFEADTLDFSFNFLKGYFSPTSSFDIACKVGVGYVAGRYREIGDARSHFVEKFNLVYGASITFNINDTFGINVEYLAMPKMTFVRHQNITNVVNFNIVKFGIVFSF